MVIEYRFPISYEMNCSINVFAYDLETCNVDYSEYCEPYGAGVYQPNNLHKHRKFGHNGSGFDNYIVLTSLPSSYKDIKILKASRG